MAAKRLPNLSECINQWRHREEQRVSLRGTDPETKHQVGTEAPAWLFRGESAEYPDTYSTMHRFSLSKLTKGAQGEVEAVTKRLDFTLREYGLSHMYSAALLQHYGLPTELIDLTSSLDAAAAFAAHGNSGTPGVLMAFPTEAIAQNAVLIDLKGIYFARRPRHQSALALFHRTLPNLKDKGLFASLRAERVTFQGSRQDLRQWEAHYEQICGPPHTDATSGLLNKLVDDVVLSHPDPKKRYSLCAEARSWIEERIPWAPVPMRPVKGEKGVMEPAWDRF